MRFFPIFAIVALYAFVTALPSTHLLEDESNYCGYVEFTHSRNSDNPRVELLRETLKGECVQSQHVLTHYFTDGCRCYFFGDKDCQNKVSGGQKQGHLVNMGARWYTCEAGLDS